MRCRQAGSGSGAARTEVMARLGKDDSFFLGAGEGNKFGFGFGFGRGEDGGAGHVKKR